MYVTDYLGSVRAVVDGRTGELYKAVDYSSYGEETIVEAASVSGGLTLRAILTRKKSCSIIVPQNLWKKVGKLPLREDLLPVQMEYIYHKFDNIQFEIYNPETGKVTPATKEECRGLEEAAVWDYGAISERIRDHYNGVPCIWLKQKDELFND